MTYDADLRGKGVRRVLDPFLALALQVAGYRANRVWRGRWRTSRGRGLMAPRLPAVDDAVS